MQRNNRKIIGQIAVAAAAATAFVPSAAKAVEVTTGAGNSQTFLISTSGATALSAFTRAGTGSTFNRGPYALGVSSLTIGDTQYSLTSAGQYIGRRDNNIAALSNEPTSGADRILYNYHEIGSVNGVIDVATANGVLVPGASFTAFNSGNPFWHQGLRLNAGVPSIGTTLSNNYVFQGKQPVRVAYSDVRFEQAFGLSGTPAIGNRPTAPGYGKAINLSGVGGTNAQELTDVGDLAGGVAPTTTRLRNDNLAVVPFTYSASTGSGMSKLTEDDVRFLQVNGRLPNGANFNVSNRDVGSGTRNQGNNNLVVDPAVGSGERDRINPLTGAELDTFPISVNEDRPGAAWRNSDKTSGSSRVRVQLIAGRMSMGVLSVGDVGARGRQTTNSEPLRVLAIDWNEAGTGAETFDGGFTQPKAQNVIDGTWHMWSASVAVTVAPYANPTLNDALVGYKPIAGDTNDQAPGAGTGVSYNTDGTVGGTYAANGIWVGETAPTVNTSVTQQGIHRKWLDNITNSVANFGSADTNETPFDAVVAQGFFPTALMGVEKAFDGDTQVARTRDAAAETAYQRLVNGVGGTPTLANNLNFADPATVTGPLSSSTYRYNIFHSANGSSAQDTATLNGNSNVSIDISPRVALAGDFDGDNVRDLKDVPALAMAYSNPAAYLATPAAGEVNGRNYNGVAVAALESATVSRTVLGTSLSITAGQEGLVVLSDLDSDGNVVSETASTGTIAAITRDDVEYFLFGAAIDTTGFVGSAAKMADGVRLGQLRKNAAIDTFNAELDLLETQGIIADADPFKFNKLDVDQDGDLDLTDVKIVNNFLGRDYTDIEHQQYAFLSFADGEAFANADITVSESMGEVVVTVDEASFAGYTNDPSRTFAISQYNLVYAELNDDNVITYGDDFALIAAAAIADGVLVEGDTDFDGDVDFDDLGILLGSYGDVGIWTGGNFNFDAEVGFDDLGLLLGNYGLGVPGAVVGELDGAAIAAINAVVPEPSALAIVAGAGLLGLRRRRA